MIEDLLCLHLRNSGIEGLIFEDSISCYRVTYKNIKNGLTNNSEMIFKTNNTIRIILHQKIMKKEKGLIDIL